MFNLIKVMQSKKSFLRFVKKWQISKKKRETVNIYLISLISMLIFYLFHIIAAKQWNKSSSFFYKMSLLMRWKHWEMIINEVEQHLQFTKYFTKLKKIIRIHSFRKRDQADIRKQYILLWHQSVLLITLFCQHLIIQEFLLKR